MLVTRRRRSRTTISIFGGIGTKEAISVSTRRQACSYIVVKRVNEVEKAEYDPRARFSIITSFVPRYAKLYIVYIQGRWVGKQKPYGSKKIGRAHV